jgi:eukaryotic-like serine/threonine-protein kinase
VTAAKSNAPANTIIRQSPPPGSAISPGEVVTVVISPGPPTASVPNVTGESMQQATATLKAAGFNVSVQKHGFGNIVTGEGPTGTQPKGTTITIAVGIGFSF